MDKFLIKRKANDSEEQNTKNGPSTSGSGSNALAAHIVSDTNGRIKRRKINRQYSEEYLILDLHTFVRKNITFHNVLYVEKNYPTARWFLPS